MQNINIKKRIPNLVLGLIFGLLAIYLTPSIWAYIFFFLSYLASVFGDRVINIFTLEAKTGKFNLKGSDVNMKVIDKNGNIISKSK